MGFIQSTEKRFYGRGLEISVAKCILKRITLGDFNLVDGERQYPHRRMYMETCDFSDCLTDTDLTEIRTIGGDYTWTNGHIFSRIDRAFGNGQWIMNLPQVEVVLFNPHFSDHCPLSFKMNCQPFAGKKPFRFFNHLVSHPQFMEIIEFCWASEVTGTPMEKVWRKLHMIKQKLKKLQIKEFSGVDTRIKELRTQLQATQQLMRSHDYPSTLFDSEKQLKNQLEKWVGIEESVLKQKSSIQWSKLGDANTPYFFASMKNRHSINMIRSLQNNNGDMLHTEEDIQQEMTKFYKSLLGSAASQLPAIRPEVMRNGVTLDRQQQLLLIHQALKKRYTRH
ncbi:uncharacterized protein LOC132039156 [Lycium ferocissimum]|uniref:uncharacterized protein LOC132039156 n=1 Tax=Lycium ferocissimum TaxID=112874 RepID=UPI002815C0C3|nr:uncharacterized protein LOC132039156 [Lycium ferocissimum]